MSDPDAGRKVIGIMPTAEMAAKAEHHFIQARLASRKWEERKAGIVETCGGDPGRIHRESVHDLRLAGYMDSFGFHQRMALLCAGMVQMRNSFHALLPVPG